MSALRTPVKSRDAGAFRTLTVLQSFDAPSDQTNPYLVQLVDALPPAVDVRYFSMRRALFSRYDVFHVHWPEYLARHRTRLGAWLKQACGRALLLRLRWSRIPIVRTLHNEAPHEIGDDGERAALARLDGQTALWIGLNAATRPREPLAMTILHGHYRDWYAPLQVPSPIQGRLLYFGLIRAYKGVDMLLAAMHALADPAVTLRVVGNPADTAMRGEVEDATARDPRIGSLLRHVDDATLAREIGEAELVVLPYREMRNSGALLLALSLDRPVLVPRSEANDALSAEVGDGWIFVYDGELQAATLSDTLGRVRWRLASARPDLSQRDWPAIGVQHYQAYRAALRHTRPDTVDVD